MSALALTKWAVVRSSAALASRGAALVSRCAALALRRFDSARENPEQFFVLNRLALALVVLTAAALQSHFGSAEAQDYFRRGLPWIQSYIVLIGLTQAHLAFRPAIQSDPPNRFDRRRRRARLRWPLPGRRCLGLSRPALFLDDPRLRGALRRGLYGRGRGEHGAWLRGRGLEDAVLAGQRRAFGRSVLLAHHHPRHGAVLLGRLNEARAEAERANRSKTVLLANVSHELRTPLTAILGLGDLLKKSGLDAAQREMVQTLSGRR